MDFESILNGACLVLFGHVLLVDVWVPAKLTAFFEENASETVVLFSFVKNLQHLVWLHPRQTMAPCSTVELTFEVLGVYFLLRLFAPVRGGYPFIPDC